jgi:hypothetical protein
MLRVRKGRNLFVVTTNIGQAWTKFGDLQCGKREQDAPGTAGGTPALRKPLSHNYFLPQ